MIAASTHRKVRKRVPDKDSMIVKWTFDSDGFTLELPLSTLGTEVYDFTVDWGDGTSDHITTSNATHTYAKAGTYYTKLTGRFDGFYIYHSQSVSSKTYISNGTSKDMLDGIVQWGTNKFYELRFVGSSLKELPIGGAAPDFSGVTDMFGLFALCKLTHNPHKHLFKKAINVTLFHAIYSRCGISETPRGLLDNLQSVDDIGSIYAHNNLTYIPVDHFIGCGTATRTTNIFRNNNISEIPAGIMDPLVNSTWMAYCFAENPWSVIPDGLFAKNPLVDDFEDCFADTNINVVPENLFGTNNTAMVLKTMFKNCNIEYIPPNLLANCPNASNFYQMFYNNPIKALVPDWWNQYPTATGTDCFALSTGSVPNAADIPTQWK